MQLIFPEEAEVQRYRSDVAGGQLLYQHSVVSSSWAGSQATQALDAL